MRSGGSERESLATAVLRSVGALDPAGVVEGRDELRDGRARDRGPARKLGCGERLGRDCAQSQELAERQLRLVECEHALDPAADESRDTDQGLDGV